MKTILTTTLAALTALHTGWSATQEPVLALPRTDSFQVPQTDPFQDVDAPGGDVIKLQAQIKQKVDAVRRQVAAASRDIQVRPFNKPLPEEGADNFTWAASGDVFAQLGEDIQDMVLRPGRGAVGPLIIAGTEHGAEKLADLTEDLTVMSRLLTKAADRETGRKSQDFAMGIVVSTLGGPRAPQSIYLEGYGALFMLNAKFPLVAPPKVEAVAAPEPQTDSSWEDAKAEVLGKRKARVRSDLNTLYKATGPEYDAQRVTELKSDVLDALKSAKNIRHLQPSEWITVTVTGANGAASPEGKTITRAYNYSTNGKDKMVIANADRAAAGDSSQSSQMIFRVKKSDVDAFANAKISAEEFEKRVQVNAR